MWTYIPNEFCPSRPVSALLNWVDKFVSRVKILLCQEEQPNNRDLMLLSRCTNRVSRFKPAPITSESRGSPCGRFLADESNCDQKSEVGARTIFTGGGVRRIRRLTI